MNSNQDETTGRRLWLLSTGALMGIFLVELTSLVVAVPLTILLMGMAVLITFRECKIRREDG